MTRLHGAVLSTALALLAVVGTARTAEAQAALDDDDSTSSTPAKMTPGNDPSQETKVGFGIRLRKVIIPTSMIELFVAHAPGGSNQTGIGFDIVRRKGNFEVQFGVERDPIQIVTGYWIDKGNTIPADEPDHVYFNDGNKGYFSEFGWYTAEVTFLNHSPITKWLAIRYGGGAGIGIFTGHVTRTDAMCDSTSISSCHDSNNNPPDTNVHTPYDIPPVMLIVNAVLGVQLRTVSNVYINIEGGIRSIPYFGTSVGYYF